MAVKTKAQLKSYFQTGLKPTQAQFEDLIDSFENANINICKLNDYLLSNGNYFAALMSDERGVASDVFNAPVISYSKHDYGADINISTDTVNNEGEFSLRIDNDPDKLAIGWMPADGFTICNVSFNLLPKVRRYMLTRPVSLQQNVTLTGSVASTLYENIANQLQFVYTYNGEQLSTHYSTPFRLCYEGKIMLFARAYHNTTANKLENVATIEVGSISRTSIQLTCSNANADYTITEIIVTEHNYSAYI